MPPIDIRPYIDLLPEVAKSPKRSMCVSYDAEADVLYVSLRKPSHATDSEMTDEDVIIRYDGDEIVGYTILRATQR